ncbi:ankyrin [Neocallimastix lanati (nom. inval.)]|nr:ankyrin [Neocallimastix sp. JGI-2020a]
MYITSSEIKELIKNSNFEELKNIFNVSKFYNDEFIKCLLILYKNKTPIKNLNYEISKDKYKILLDIKKGYFFSLRDTYIIENENEILLKFLVNHGVDISKIFYKNNKMPLFDLCEMEHGANINKDNNYIEKVLFKAIESGNNYLVKRLVENGLDINKENEYGETLLIKIFDSGNKDIIEYLLENGVDYK